MDIQVRNIYLIYANISNIFPNLFPLNQLSLGFGTTNLMTPVKRNPLTLESFVINVDGQEVILTLANKSQLGQDTDLEQSLHDSNTSATDKGLDFGQQTNASLGS